MNFNRGLVESELPQVTSTPVAHYTRIGTLCHFIPHGSSGWASARATPVQFLNDRMELSLGLQMLKDVAVRPPRSGNRVRTIIDTLLTSAGRLETDAFQMSFSGDPDELGQWRGYAANGMGCSVVTDSVSLHQIADVAGWVIYEVPKQQAFAYKILAKLRNMQDDALIEEVLIAAACYMKHDGFKPEKEFRILKFPSPAEVGFRETGDRLVPFVDFLQGQQPLPISRIVIGPGWQLANLQTSELSRNHVVQGIHRLLSARGMNSTTIDRSRIPYDPK